MTLHIGGVCAFSEFSPGPSLVRATLPPPAVELQSLLRSAKMAARPTAEAAEQQLVQDMQEIPQLQEQLRELREMWGQ